MIEPNEELCVDICGAKCCKATNMMLPVSRTEMRRMKRLVPGIHFTHRPDAGKRIYFVEFWRTWGCPALGDDNRCSIYEDRPLNCRGFPWEPFAGCLLSPAEGKSRFVLPDVPSPQPISVSLTTTSAVQTPQDAPAPAALPVSAIS